MKHYILSFFNISKLLALFLFCVTLSDARPQTEKKSSNEFIKKFAPYVLDIKGNTISLDQINQRYIFVFYGAEWCPFCRGFAPILKRFIETYQEKYQDFAVVFWGDTRDQTQEQLSKFLINHKLDELMPSMDLAHRGDDTLGDLRYGLGIPDLLLFDSQGNKLADSYTQNGEYQGRMIAIDTYLSLHNEINSNFSRWADKMPLQT